MSPQRVAVVAACVVVVAAFVATPARAVDKLLILDFEHEPALDPTARLVNDLIAASVEKHAHYEVITGADIKRVLALEADRQEAGKCAGDQPSCLAELAGAMGAQLIVFGQVGKLDDTYVITINFFDAAKSVSRGRRTIQAATEKDLPQQIDSAMASLLGVDDGPPVLGIGLVAGGVVVAAAGVGLAGAMNEALRDPAATGKDTTFVLGHAFLWGGVVVGAAVAVAGGLVLGGVVGGAE